MSVPVSWELTHSCWRGAAGASVDALRAEWWNQPATNQTDEPRTTGTDGGAAGPMLDPHSVLDNLWGGRKGKLTEVGSGEYDVPQVSSAVAPAYALVCRGFSGTTFKLLWF